jgi:hypothetical protein
VVTTSRTLGSCWSQNHKTRFFQFASSSYIMLYGTALLSALAATLATSQAAPINVETRGLNLRIGTVTNGLHFGEKKDRSDIPVEAKMLVSCECHPRLSLPMADIFSVRNANPPCQTS